MPLLLLLCWLQLTPPQYAWIGEKIWFNECRGTVEGLTTWNPGEEFPSLGIGHFIWFPEGVQVPFVESFPAFVRFARERGNQPPAVALAAHAPWPSRQQFEQADKSELRDWLAATVPLQTAFVVARMEASAASLTPAQKANFEKVASTPNGVYALIDYVNFKGEGKETYRGQGWGLSWVLDAMHDVPAGPRAALEFSRAAQRCLDRRIANSPPERDEQRWREGWDKRCETYAQPLQVVSRAMWGSTPQPLGEELRQTPTHLVVHHAGVATKPGEDPAEKMRRLQSWGQREKGWPDVPYHYVIAPDGRIFEGRDWHYRPESNTQYDLNGVINVEVDGDFETEQPTPEQKESLVEILTYLCLRHDIDPSQITGHRDQAPGQTDCPGASLYPFVHQELQREVRKRL